jgi:hypothetical protein
MTVKTRPPSAQEKIMSTSPTGGMKPMLEDEGNIPDDAEPIPDGAPDITEDAIRLRAYELWMADGCPEGHQADHWREAERRLRSGMD